MEAVIAVAAAEVHLQIQTPLALHARLDCLGAIRTGPHIEPLMLCRAAALTHVRLVGIADGLHHPADPPNRLHFIVIAVAVSWSSLSCFTSVSLHL